MNTGHTMDKLKMHSPDLTQDNIARIRELFPGCVTEAADKNGKLRLAVDFDQLRQELSDQAVEGARERYQLDWPGKREAILLGSAPVLKTLRPKREESLNFATTRNLFIEGDNLEVIKLLQESYLNEVKLIYIDPPYNTGNDFIYRDRFSISNPQYLSASEQRDSSGRPMTLNPESNGRFHSEWLSMMYPRLKLARSLLRPDGALLISADDSEIHNLRKLCDEIFGSENFVAQLAWKSRVSEDTRAITGISTDHEYILCYARSEMGLFRGVDKDTEKFSNADADPRGPWRSADLTGLATKDARPNLHYDLVDPATNRTFPCPPKGWRYEPSTMATKISEGRIIFPDDVTGRPRHKLFLNEMKSLFKNMSSVVQGFSTADGTREVNALMGANVFSFPKPLGLMQMLIEQLTEADSVVMDFFAGSGTTGHAVMKQSLSDGLERRFVLVQWPEELVPENKNQRSGMDFCDSIKRPRNIAELTKERLRKAATQIASDDPHNRVDTGFRVLKVDSSNMADVYYSPDAVNQDLLADQVDNIRPGRTPEDLLFQVLLDWGVDLSLPIRQESIAGKTVFFVDDTALAACFDLDVDEAFVKTLAGYKPLRVVFRDSGFASDSVKINVEQLFKLLSPATEIKTI